uniref:ATP synthase subunit a n=2 Tax=Selaginella moellendorffii TaxID=88036 RepID=F2YMP6_SELML|nr:ATP synthase subunit 6 [Selaginella moellendorffii]
MVCSPLEQFAIIPLIPIEIGPFFLSFTNSSLFILVTLQTTLAGVKAATRQGGHIVPNAWEAVGEMIYDFVHTVVKEHIAPPAVKQRVFPLIFGTFIFLALANLLGMIPYSVTVTSHFICTLGLAFSLFFGISVVGFQTYGLHFFTLLLPRGVPPALVPFLVILELISYCFRALSLGIRLFANMMAGHSLVKILCGFAWTMASMGGLMYVACLAPFLIVSALIGLELSVAFLQAYVFTTPIRIYPNDAMTLH